MSPGDYESDAADPNDEHIAPSGVPATRHPNALDAFFASEHAAQADADKPTGSSERLAALFAGEPAPRPDPDDRDGALGNAWWDEPDAPTGPLLEAADEGPYVSEASPEPTTPLASALPPPPSPASPAGTFAARSRPPGVRGALFGSATRATISIVAAVVLIAGIVWGAVFGADTLAANARLATARTALASAQSSIDQPASDLAQATTAYDDTAKTAQATANTTGRTLKAVAGIPDAKTLAAVTAAQAALVKALAQGPPAAPEPYTPARVDTSDITAVKAETRRARDHVRKLTATTTALQSSKSDLDTLLAALLVAKKALGSSLPKTAAAIVAQNDQAEQSFRDAVTAAAKAVTKAQAAGKSGDAEIVAFAVAVKALRADQERALAQSGSTNPGSGNQTTNPVTTPSPSPSPTPKPSPKPSPTPAPTPTP